MSVIEFAKRRLLEESRIPDSPDTLYWRAYLDGALAQQGEDMRERARETNGKNKEEKEA